jgi:hypothetical protein
MFNFYIKRPKYSTEKRSRKGVVLLIVLITILVVVILAELILRLASSQSRLTGHYTNRVQAYYACLAGINIALDKLRDGQWKYIAGASPTNDCPDASPCTISPAEAPPKNVAEYDLPKSIQGGLVKIVFCQPGQRCISASHPICSPPAGVDFCIYSSANYTTFAE